MTKNKTKIFIGIGFLICLIGSNLLCHQLSSRSAKERYREELAAKEQEIDRLAAEYEEESEKQLEENLAQLESLREEIKDLNFQQVEEEPERQPATWETMLEGFGQEPSTATKEEVMEAYEAFLNGERNVDSVTGLSIEDIAFPVGEPDKPWWTAYAYIDLNGDGLPELLVDSARYDSLILTYQAGELIIWRPFKEDGKHEWTLCSNGDFSIYRLPGAGEGEWYYYVALNQKGEEIWYLEYGWEYVEDTDYSEREYYFDGIKMSEKEWKSCINKLPLDELEMTVLYEGR